MQDIVRPLPSYMFLYQYLPLFPTVLSDETSLRSHRVGCSR